MATLTLKLPENKPPFIGVILSDDNKSVQLNLDLITHPQYSVAEYTIIIECYRNTMDIKLLCDDYVIRRIYRDIKFDVEKLKRWWELSAKAPSYNFGHVIKINETDTIMKLVGTKKPIAWKVTKLKILSQDDFF